MRTTSRPHPDPLPEGEGLSTPIDRLQITVAGQRMSVRQAAMRILRKSSLNFGEEFLLLWIVGLSDKRNLSVQDIEYAFDNWSTSRGCDSMNYLKGIVKRIVDENQRQKLLHRPPTPRKLPEIVLELEEAGRFLNWLRERHYHGLMSARPDKRTAFAAEDVEHWYERFREDAIREEQGERIMGDGK